MLRGVKGEEKVEEDGVVEAVRRGYWGLAQVGQNRPIFLSYHSPTSLTIIPFSPRQISSSSFSSCLCRRGEERRDGEGKKIGECKLSLNI